MRPWTSSELSDESLTKLGTYVAVLNLRTP